MALLVLGLHCESPNAIPLLMERSDTTRNNTELVIDITSSGNSAASSSSHERRSIGLEDQHSQDRPSTSSRDPHYQPPLLSAGGSNRRSSSLLQRANSRSLQRSPLNSALWISVELALTVSQITAAIIVLSLSKHEKPRAPLRTWIVGYASGCVAILPLLYWRFNYRNQGTELDPSQRSQDSLFGSNSTGPLTRRGVEEEDNSSSGAMTMGTSINRRRPHPRLKAFVEYLKMGLDCFFAVWFVVGNVWIFGWHSSASESPQLYRLCIVLLTFNCIGYAMPFILCATICCCLPCIISVLGVSEDLSQNRGATQDLINSLPTYKFKSKINKTTSDKESCSSIGEGGIVAAGTEKERAISEEDAVCCICLAKYVNNDNLKELPCSHLFHKDCVDKWLKINATCPLCKAEVGETVGSSSAETNANL